MSEMVKRFHTCLVGQQSIMVFGNIICQNFKRRFKNLIDGVGEAIAYVAHGPVAVLKPNSIKKRTCIEHETTAELGRSSTLHCARAHVFVLAANVFQLTNKSCPGFELPPVFPRQNCASDRDCWPRICCEYGGANGHAYCRIPLPSWRNDLLKTIIKSEYIIRLSRGYSTRVQHDTDRRTLFLLERLRNGKFSISFTVLYRVFNLKAH